MTINADVVLVSSSGWAHGVTATGAKLVYCYSPARWLHQQRRYLGDHPSRAAAVALKLMSPWLRRWDLRAALSASAYVTISSVVQDRVNSGYGLPSTVLPAPRPGTDQCPSEPMPAVERWLDGSGFELCVSRLLPYKNVDQIVAAFASEPRRRLVVVGRGPQLDTLRAVAGANVLFLQNITDGELAWLYRRSNALIAISYEDFGLTPLEAAAFGRPSILLRWGGYLESMVENVTSVFIDVPEAQHVRSALEELDTREWDAARIIEHAARYHEDVFIENIRELVKAQLDRHDRT